AHKEIIMGQAQDKFVDEQNDEGSQDSSTVENSVVTEATITVVASESQAHHDNGFLPLSTKDSQIKGNGPNSLFNDTDPGEIPNEKVKTFTSDGNGHMDLTEKSDNYTIRLTTSTIDYTNNSLASSLASLSVRDSSSSDCIPTASVVQATTVKNIVKETNNEMSKNCEENFNTCVEEASINTGKNELVRKKTSKEIKSTLADEAEYTIPAAIAEDVLREMLANKPSQDLLEELEPTPVITNGKGENSSSKFTVNHEKNGESSETSKSSIKKNNLLISSGTTDSPFPSKFTFPNIADKNFFLPNFSNTTTSSPSFPFGNSSELSLQNPFQSPSISSPNAPANSPNPKDQRRVTSQWHPPVLDKFSPQLSSKTPITMPSSSIWPPSINTTSPTDTQFSNSNLLFPQFTGSFKFDMNSKAAVSGPQSSNLPPPPLVRPSTPPFTTTPPLSPPVKTLPVSPPTSTVKKGVHSNVGASRTTTFTSTLQTSPSRGFAHNATNTFPFFRPIRKLPSRAKSRLSQNGNPNGSNNSNNNSLVSSEINSSVRFNGKNEIIVNTPSVQPLQMIPPSPLFSFTTPTNSEEEEDFDAEEEDGGNDNNHCDWLDNANNKKKRKALQTVGGSSTTSSGVGGVIKTSTAKERTNPLRRVERRLTQRSNSIMNKVSSSGDTVSQFDKVFNKETNSMRPPQTTFDFSFKSIPEKSAALAASVNAASAKRLAAVSPIQTMNAKNDPFSSSLFLQQTPTVTTVPTSSASKKKASTKRAAPSSVAFKNDDIATNHNHIRPQPINNSNIPRRKIRFPEKSGDWICMFCEYRLYYGEGKRRRRPKTNIGNVNGGEGGSNNTGEGGNGLDKAIAT
ncbi:2583_t:CDS:2, partial [Acaulospora morrowiae]